MALPPGPTAPRAVQTMAWVSRTGPWLRRLNDRYGDTFTITIGHEPNWVILADPDAVREVFTGDPEVFHAGEGNEILRPVLGSRSVLLLDEKPHMQARKRLLPPFHGERMKTWNQVMTEVAEREIAGWPRDEPTQLLPRTQALTLEVIMRTIFGSEDPRLRDGLRKAMDDMGSPVGMALLGILGPQRVGRLPIFRRLIDPLDALLLAHIRARRDVPDLAERTDVLSTLIAAGMDDEELRDELMTLLVAGHETTATALAWAVERLVRHPQGWEALREGDEEWADAVVKETLRLRPVLPVVVRKLTRPATVAGLDLPEGVVVAPCIWLIHRRADVYAEPNAFRPERFVGVKPGTYTWIPFGGGVRRCVGAAFAEMEMRVVLQAMARGLDVRAVHSASEPVRRRTITMTPSRGAEVVISGNPRPAKGVPVEQELTV